MGGINLHGSLLPKYRGAAPVQCALLSGDVGNGSLSHSHDSQTRRRPQSSPCEKQKSLRNETSGELEERLAMLGVNATLEAVEHAECTGTVCPSLGTLQDPAAITKAPRLRKSDADIDWDRTRSA